MNVLFFCLSIISIILSNNRFVKSWFLTRKSLITPISLSLSTSIMSKEKFISLHVFPELVVLDLDACLWHPETYTLESIPNENCRILGKLGELDTEGYIAVNAGNENLRLFPDVLRILQHYYSGAYGCMRLAIASSADTPHATKIAHASLKLLEVFQGVSVQQVVNKGWPEGFTGNIQIGRQYPLTKFKATSHFPIIKSNTNIDYSKMVYFDDCLWDDHCDHVARQCKGVVTQRTPNGLTINDWNQALLRYQLLNVQK